MPASDYDVKGGHPDPLEEAFELAYRNLLTTHKRRGASGRYAAKGQDTTGDGQADDRGETRLERDEARLLWQAAYDMGLAAGRLERRAEEMVRVEVLEEDGEERDAPTDT
jgi:hypothetical protein